MSPRVDRGIALLSAYYDSIKDNKSQVITLQFSLIYQQILGYLHSRLGMLWLRMRHCHGIMRKLLYERYNSNKVY